MTRVFAATIICLVSWSKAVSGDSRWLTLRPGVEVLRGEFSDRSGAVKFVLYRCDPVKTEIRVIDTFHDLGSGGTLGTFSLKDVIKTGALLAANGGSTASYSIPIPVGLLMVHGKLISAPNLRAQEAPGFLCIAGNRMGIEEIKSFQSKACTYAVQRGPLLSRATARLVSSPYRRTVIAIDQRHQLLILVTIDKSTLSGIREFLYGDSADLKVQSALNMDGDTSSGLLVAPELRAEPSEVGNVDSLLASAIAVYPRN